MTIVSVVLIACIAATPVMPRLSQWLVIGCYCVSLLPLGYTVVQDVSLAIAIGILAYLYPFTDGVAAVVVATIGGQINAVVVYSQSSFFDIAAFARVILPLATAWVCGYAANLHQKSIHMQRLAEKHLAAEKENERLQANAKIAVRMHDTLTNDLSCISAIAHQHPDDPEWNVILRRSQSAFVQAHAVIDYLSGRGIREGDGGPFMERLRQQLDEDGKYLDFLGYHGVPELHGEALVTTHDAEEEILALLKEIGTNIQRHAVPGDESYILNVDVTAEGVEIFETNDVSRTVLSEAERSGRGLAMHREQIKRLGGILDTNLDGQLWILHADIPWDKRMMVPKR
ncbi:hypothetical protein JS528_06595 [Bifidobacterium sp. MA2]|uniref:Histidine kinase n=1 Tax=Bifidobacterium santillanense TaxID=2809028 RepID=A0ABS5UQB0_9BIFI|nr:hypothetical protein [Bifidobacterium santillanense]MBT1173029.1 hypothetical protein [Bifidobacterium santillanense]